MKPFPFRTLTLLVLVLLAIIVPFCLFGTSVNDWTRRLIAQAGTHRYMTGALLTALLAVDSVMPVPSSLISTACGLTLGFFGGTLASFIGMTLSSTTGYLLGRYASAPAETLIGKEEVARLNAFHARHGIWVLLALRPVPVLAETSMLFSGLSRQALPQVVAVTALGNLSGSAVYAAVGVW
ncbi:MAG: VTT domain-containing protein, partial [bacterium]